MNISKQRKVYAGILGLAVAAWAVDRFCLKGGPDVAAAGMAPAAELAVPHAAQSRSGAGPAAAAGIGLAARLDELRAVQPTSRELDDAFLVPVDWRPEAAKAKAEAKDAPRFDVEAFVKVHRLTAVMLGSDASGNAAVLDGGTILRPGDSVDGTPGGMILREVTREKTAVFERDGVVVELRIERTKRASGTDGKVGASSENGGDSGKGG